MKFFKSSIVFCSLILSINNSFAVLGVEGVSDEQYVQAATPYKAVGMVVSYRGQGDALRCAQSFTGTLIQHQGRSAVLTVAHAFDQPPEYDRVWICEGKGFKITDHVIYPPYLRAKQPPNADEAKVFSLPHDFALAFLEKYPEEVATYSVAAHPFDYFKTPQCVKIVGCGRGGFFNSQHVGKTTKISGQRRLCKGMLRSHQYSLEKSVPFLKAAPYTGELAGTVSYGDSGAPAFNENGNIIALASAVNMEKGFGHFSPITPEVLTWMTATLEQRDRPESLASAALGLLHTVGQIVLGYNTL